MWISIVSLEFDICMYVYIYICWYYNIDLIDILNTSGKLKKQC